MGIALPRTLLASPTRTALAGRAFARGAEAGRNTFVFCWHAKKVNRWCAPPPHTKIHKKRGGGRASGRLGRSKWPCAPPPPRQERARMKNLSPFKKDTAILRASNKQASARAPVLHGQTYIFTPARAHALVHRVLYKQVLPAHAGTRASSLPAHARTTRSMRITHARTRKKKGPRVHLTRASRALQTSPRASSAVHARTHAHHAHYTRTRAMKEKGPRSSFLPAPRAHTPSLPPRPFSRRPANENGTAHPARARTPNKKDKHARRPLAKRNGQARASVPPARPRACQKIQALSLRARSKPTSKKTARARPRPTSPHAAACSRSCSSTQKILICYPTREEDGRDGPHAEEDRGARRATPRLALGRAIAPPSTRTTLFVYWCILGTATLHRAHHTKNACLASLCAHARARGHGQERDRLPSLFLGKR